MKELSSELVDPHKTNFPARWISCKDDRVRHVPTAMALSTEQRPDPEPCHVGYHIGTLDPGPSPPVAWSRVDP